jgi:hypothetical protein
MKHLPSSAFAIAAALLLAHAPLLRGQDFPKISTRQFTGGSAKVQVTGAFSINEDAPIDTQGSYGDGEVTWLRFGASGSEKPNVTISYGETREIGITVGRGKLVATGGITPGEKSACSGTAKVTATLVSGTYTCRAVTSYDPATRRQGKVDIVVTFTAKS